MQRYIGTSIVAAEPMDLFTARRQWLVDWFEDPHVGTNQPGYAVVDEDGDRSWAPKEWFERCHRPITNAERRLLGVPSIEDMPQTQRPEQAPHE